MRLVVIGDVGVTDAMMHIGDEAMFEAMVGQFTRRGAQVTGISADPTETAERYGIDAIQRIGFDMSLGRDAAEARLRAIIDAAATGASTPDATPGGLASDDPAWGVIDAVRAADGVAVAGGGNMASNWPMHIFERRALAGIASATNTPFVVSGQTLGPELTTEDRELIREIGEIARRLGVREVASARLATELGIDDDVLRQTVDDASFLVDDAGSDTVGPYVLVSLSTHLGGRPRTTAVEAIAALLDRLATATGAEVRFHAHWGSLRDDEIRGDSVLHDEVRRAMTTPSTVVPTGDSPAAARLARGAALLVSSRYHPVVFAVPAGVPTLGMYVDGYTKVKLTGALGNFDQTGVVSIDDVIDGSAAGRADGLWNSREGIRARGLAAAERRRPESDRWWDELFEVLQG